MRRGRRDYIRKVQSTECRVKDKSKFHGGGGGIGSGGDLALLPP